MTMRDRLRLGLASVLVLCGSMALSQSAAGSTIRAVTVGEMLDESALIFEGVVVLHEEGVATAGGDIRTCVLFEVSDVIKGVDPGAELTLCFSGGTAEGVTLAIAGSSIPEEGERGIYFVESVEDRLINPLFGWSQGHFLIKSSSRTKSATGAPELASTRVETARGRAVLQVENGTRKQASKLASGVAAGVSEGSSPSDANELSPEEFKLQLRGLLEE